MKAQKAAKRQAYQELKEVAIRHNLGQSELPSQSIGPTQAKKSRRKPVKAPEPTIPLPEVEEAVLATSRKRRVQLPQRFAY